MRVERTNEWSDDDVLPETDKYKVPAYTGLYQESFSFEEKYEPGDIGAWEYEYDEGTLNISVSGDETRPQVIVVTDDLDVSKAFWTGVQWARDFGVPGVCVETYKFTRNLQVVYRFRLGGLYRYMGYELTKRERNYREYGQNPKTN